MALAFNYKDGDPKYKGKLSKREEAMAVEEVPGLLDHFAYLLFPASAISGPFFEFRPFDEFINLRGKYGKLTPTQCWAPAVKRFVQGFICIAITVGFPLVFGTPSRDTIISGEFETNEASVFYKIYAMSVMCHNEMWTYYVGFCFMEATMTATGLSYDEKPDGTIEYNAFPSVQIWTIESAHEVSTCLRAWNISVHNWLKYYVFIRCMDRNYKGF